MIIDCTYSECENATRMTEGWIMVSRAVGTEAEYYCSEECLGLHNTNLVIEQVRQTLKDEITEQLDEKAIGGDLSDYFTLSSYEFKEFLTMATLYEQELRGKGDKSAPGELIKKISNVLLKEYEEFINSRKEANIKAEGSKSPHP